VSKNKTPEDESEPEVHFVHIDHGGGPSIEVGGMIVLGLGEASLRRDFPELFMPPEDDLPTNPDDEPELGV
jgi:hypothetical protein